MNIRASLVTGTLTAGAAFTSAFLLARSPGREGSDGSTYPARSTVGNVSSTGAARNTRASRYHDAVLSRALANADLAAAVKDIMAQPKDQCAGARLICLVESLSPAQLAELPRLLQNNRENDLVMRSVLGAWAQRDVAGARAWVDAHPDLNESGRQAFLRGWTRASPETVVSWLDSQPLSSASISQREAVVEAMSETNPAAAFELMKSRGWTPQNPAAMLNVLRNWGGVAPQSALAGLRSFAVETGLNLQAAACEDHTWSENQRSFHWMLSALLNGAFNRNPAEALPLLGRFTATELAMGRSAIANEVMNRDPGAVAALFTAHPDAGQRRTLLAVAAASPPLAITELAKVADPGFQRDLLIAATAGFQPKSATPVIPEASRETIARLLASIPDEETRAHSTGALIVANTRNAPAWCAALWAGLPTEHQQQTGSSFFKQAAAADAGLALAAYAASAPEVQTDSLKGLCSGLASTRPEQALQLILQREEPALQAECAAALFAGWAKTSSVAGLAALEANASQLDLRAILEKLPGVPDDYHGQKFTWMEFGAKSLVETKLHLLLGDPAPVSEPTRSAPFPGGYP